MSKQKDTVTTKDINKAAFRYMFMACNTFNYETQQGPAVVFGVNHSYLRYRLEVGASWVLC